MYLAGVSVRRVEDITEAFWGSRVSPGTISNLNKKAYGDIEAWRNHLLPSEQYPYVFIDGIYLKRSWGGEFENVAILITIAVNQDGYREVIGAVEEIKEDKESWKSFLFSLRNRGLKGMQMIMKLNKDAGKLLEGISKTLPYMELSRRTLKEDPYKQRHWATKSWDSSPYACR